MGYGCNIETYLGWRGDIPFSVSPFADADALVLCKLAYFDLSAIPEAANDAGISLAGCVKKAANTIVPKGLNSEGKGFFEQAARSVRFGSILVRHYVDTVPESEGTQFSASEFVLPDGTIFVAFRGTDSTILGWKEDFELSFKKTVAQERAQAYMAASLRHAEKEGTRLLVGGHSKGANLAQIATYALDEKSLSQIDAIYLLDGPGLCPDLVSKDPLPAWSAKVHRIIPTFSVFGRIFEPAIEPKVVRSSADGMLQHELLSWQLADGKLDTTSSPDAQSDWFASVLHEWLDDVSLEQRQEFTDDLFSAIARAGSTTSEISATLAQSLPTILEGVTASRPGAKKAAAKLPLRLMAGRVADALSQSFDIRWFLVNGLAHCLELAAGGVLLITLNSVAIPLALSLALFVIAAILFAEMIIRLKASGWDMKQEQPRVAAFLVAALIFALTIVKPDALYVYASLAFGIVLGIGAWSYAGKARSGTKRGTSPVFNGFIAASLALSAAFVLIAPPDTFRAYATSLGYILLLCSVAAFLDWRHDVMEAAS